MNNKKVDKPAQPIETDEYDINYFFKLLLVVVIFTLMHFFSK